jgi:uncharacterized membrane protein
MRFVQPNIYLYFFLLILGISGSFFAVIWPQAEGFYAFIAFAAAGGFGVALYIFHTKKHKHQLVCPVGSNCNVVMTSQYSKFLGVSLEYWGMFYYSVIFVTYVILIFAPHLLSELFLSGLIMLTVGAFLFSLYLLFVQAFILRQWCIWCLLSAMLSITIFIVSLIKVDVAVAFLTEMTTAIEALRSFGFIFGTGGATATLFLFVKFLRDSDISEDELQALKGISELIWLGLFLTLISQYVSFVAHAEILTKSGLFLVQTTALFVVAIGGAILMIIFAPFLAVIPFAQTSQDQRPSPLESLRRPLFITGVVTLSSWYFAFILNYLPEYKLANLYAVYAVVLVVSIIVALLWEKRIEKNSL